MFYSRSNNINERTSYVPKLCYKRVMCQNYAISFINVLAKDNSFTIHHKNLQKLVTELFKVKVVITPEIMGSFFKLKISFVISVRSFYC